LIDWTGFDCYGDFTTCNVTARQNAVRSWLTPQQRLIAMPNTASVPGGYPSGVPSLTYQDGVINNNINNWQTVINGDGKFILVMPFLWHVDGEWWGAADMLWLRNR